MKTLSVENRAKIFMVKFGRTSICVAKELVAKEVYLVLAVAAMLRGKRTTADMDDLIMALWNACDSRLRRRYYDDEYITRRTLVWNTLSFYRGWQLAPAVCEVTQAHKEIVEEKMVEKFEGHEVFVGQYGGKYIVVNGKKHYIGTETGQRYARSVVKPADDMFFGKKVITRRFIEVDGLEYEVTTSEDQMRTLDELKNNLVGDVLVDGAVEPVVEPVDVVTVVEPVVEPVTVVEPVVTVVEPVDVVTVVEPVDVVTVVEPVIDVVDVGETFEGLPVLKRKRTRFVVIGGKEMKINTEKQRGEARALLNVGQVASILESLGAVEVDVEVDLW